MPITLLDRERRLLTEALRTGAYAVAVLWVLHGLRLLLGMPAASWGILPRRLDGLHGILTAPLAHEGWGHLANNSVPLFAGLVLLRYFFPRVAGRAMVWLYLGTGAVVWLLARGAGWGAEVTVSHVGASGVAYALIAFLFWLGVFKRSVASVVVALIIVVYFSGMLAGVVPSEPHVSWESHLLGAIVGGVTAYALRRQTLSDREPPPEVPYVGEPVLPADTFAYTLAERAEQRRRAVEEARRRWLAEQARRELGGE